MQKKRYEILLPLMHNDGRPVSGEAFEQTRAELVAQFGGLSLDPRTVFGIWMHGGTRDEDESMLFTVDVDETPENHQFFETVAKLVQVARARFA